ncbi:MAG: class I SAM-dependent methyltransferase [Ktedonobacteraceae bacterium]
MTQTAYHGASALQERVQEPTSSQAPDLSTWVMDHLALHTGHKVLDIGGGNGPQALPLAQLVGYNGHVLSIDRSYEALHALGQRSQELGLEARIRLLQINLDDLAGHLRDEDFDRVLASRSLYRIKQPYSVFKAIHDALKLGGTFFFYGPSRRNNLEIKRFHAALYGEVFSLNSKNLTFLEEVGLPVARDCFAEVEIVRFEQPLILKSPEALYTCWRTSKLYAEELDAHCRRAVIRYFESHTAFETVKRVVGIKALK